MRYLIRFRYDGTCFHGFQRQKELKSVQGTLENALSPKRNTAKRDVPFGKSSLWIANGMSALYYSASEMSLS